MTHDPCCPLDDMPTADCAICTAIAEARGQEKTAFDGVWKANIAPIERRSYERGYRDGVNGRPMDWTRW